MLNPWYTPSSAGYVLRIFWTAQAGSGTRTCFPNHPQHHLASCLYPMYRMRLKMFFMFKYSSMLFCYHCYLLQTSLFVFFQIIFDFLLLRNKDDILLYILMNSYNRGRYNMLLLLHS